MCLADKRRDSLSGDNMEIFSIDFIQLFGTEIVLKFAVLP